MKVQKQKEMRNKMYQKRIKQIEQKQVIQHQNKIKIYLNQ